MYADGNNFPTASYKQSNYFVDAVYSATDDSLVMVNATSLFVGATLVLMISMVFAIFSKDVALSGISIQFWDFSGTVFLGIIMYSAVIRTATFNPI